MGYKNENLKHRQGLNSFTHKCPNCDHKKNFGSKPPSIVVCGNCNVVVDGDKLIKI